MTHATPHREQRRKRHRWVSLVLRLGIALAGIAYILYVVQWSDRIELQPGFEMPDGTVLAESRFVDLSSEQAIEGLASGVFVVELPGQPTPLRLEVPETEEAALDEPGFVYRPGVVRTVSGAAYGYLVIALLICAVILPIQMVRWQLLLKARQMVVPWLKVLRLVMVGMFFNICMPGTTGGDVVKAYYAAAKSDRRTDAVMSVVVDRVLGLLGLILLAGIVGLFMLSDPVARAVTIYIWLFAGIGAVGATVYFSGRLRRRLGLNWLIAHLPGRGFLQKIDAAAVAYRHHPGVLVFGLVISMVNHTVLAGATALAGYALGLETPLGVLMTVLPVVIFSAALPISYQGFGVMEYLAIEMLLEPGVATANQIVGMLMLFRGFLIFYALVGSLSLIGGDIHAQHATDELTDELADDGPIDSVETDSTVAGGT